jgi:epoxide hydrolase-like predicted phosphatase
MIKGLLFDVGGVLLNLDDYNPVKSVANFYNIDETVVVKLLDKHLAKLGEEYIGRSGEEQLWKAVVSEISSAREDISHFIPNEDIEKSAKKNYKVLEELESLKERGFVVGILSNTNIIHKKTNILQEIYSHVDVLLLSCDIGVRKPKKEAFMKALEVMELKPEEIVFIDDQEVNIESAQRLGFKTVLAEDEGQIVRDIERLLDQ